MRPQSYILIAVAIVCTCVAVIITMLLPTSQPTLNDTESIEGVLDVISTNTRLDGPDFYTYWFVDGVGFYSDTLVGTLIIPMDRLQPPWQTGKTYQVEYRIEPNWWATVITWEEVTK